LPEGVQQQLTRINRIVYFNVLWRKHFTLLRAGF